MAELKSRKEEISAAFDAVWKTKEAPTPAVDNSVCVRVAFVSDVGAREEHDVPQGHRLFQVYVAKVELGMQYLTFRGELVLGRDTPLALGLTDGDELLLVSRKDHMERLMDFVGKNAGTERCGFALGDMLQFCLFKDSTIHKVAPPPSISVDFVTALAGEFDPEAHPPLLVWLARNIEGGGDRLCENEHILEGLFLGMRSADALGLKFVGASSKFSVKLSEALYVAAPRRSIVRPP
jgi:hypothetical protein